MGLKRPNYYHIPTVVAEQCTPHESFVFAVIQWFEKMKDGKCFASNSVIAEALPYDSHNLSVANALTSLEKKGLIRRYFADESKKKRTEIVSLVDYKVSPGDDTGYNEAVIWVSRDNEQNNNIEYKERIISAEPEKNENFGFPLPEGWVDDSFYEEDKYILVLLDDKGQKVRQSDITKLRKEYEARKKARVSSAKRAKTMNDTAKGMVQTLCEEQGIPNLDGSDNYGHANSLKIKFREHLVSDMGLSSSLTDESLLEQFQAFLGGMRDKSGFHWKNATSMGYINRNFNKIIRDL